MTLPIFNLVIHYDPKWRNMTNEDSTQLNINMEAYHQLLDQEGWFNQNLGRYAAFAFGELIGVFEDEETLFEQLDKNYAQASVFFARVGNKDILEVPTPLSVEEEL